MSLPPVVFVLVQSTAAADGGISSISQIIAGLRRHRPIIVTDRETDRVADWRRQGVEVVVVPQSASHGLGRDPIGVVRSYGRYTSAMRNVLSRSGATVVHANDPAAFQLAALGAKSRRARIALNLRDTLDPGRKAPGLRYRALFAAADHVFYLSKDMADRWVDVAPNAKREWSVTYSVVDLQRFKPLPQPATDEPMVLLSGIIRAKKGQLQFLRNVAPKLAAEGISTWLAGDFDPARNAYMADCAQAAEPLGERVRFLGYRSDVADLIAQSSAVTVASRHEGLVRSMIEAMASARPVVSFDVCSAREMLEQQSGGAGTVLETDDYTGMAAALIHYARDPDAAAQAGAKGRLTAERLFQADKVVDRYEDVYEALAAR